MFQLTLFYFIFLYNIPYTNIFEFLHDFILCCSLKSVYPDFLSCLFPENKIGAEAQHALGKMCSGASGMKNCVHFNKWMNEGTGIVNCFHPQLKTEQN